MKFSLESFSCVDKWDLHHVSCRVTVVHSEIKIDCLSWSVSEQFRPLLGRRLKSSTDESRAPTCPGLTAPIPILQKPQIDDIGLWASTTVSNGSTSPDTLRKAACPTTELCSTGFYVNTGLEDSLSDSAGNKSISSSLNDSEQQLSFYPRYSNGVNSDSTVPLSQVPAIVQHLLQHYSKSMMSVTQPGLEGNSFRNYRSLDEGKFCAFCRKNKERREFYTTHVVKDSWGKVICPVLRKYICPVCGATGDEAHTISHCPARFKGTC